VVDAVLAHAHEQYRTDLMAKAVVHADAIAGLLVTVALVHPERSADRRIDNALRAVPMDVKEPAESSAHRLGRPRSRSCRRRRSGWTA